VANETLKAMTDKKRIYLESELVRIAKGLAIPIHTQAPAYAVPYKASNGKFVYVVVGPKNAIHGLVARMKTE
jgi:hypothetical protein